MARWVREAATAFNSLFEMLLVLCSYVCQRDKAFNSLFEMPFSPRLVLKLGTVELSILYLRCGVCVCVEEEHVPAPPFNSLFEMPPAARGGGRSAYRPFNSLFEMPYDDKAPAIQRHRRLSILYLRCRLPARGT